MGRRVSFLAVMSASIVVGCASEAARPGVQVDAREVVDVAVVRAARCASDLDELAVSSPESAWSALDAGTAPVRIAPPRAADREGLVRKDRTEIERRLQAVLDSRNAVDRIAAHTGPWGTPQDGSSLASHARTVSDELCRIRDVAQALAQSPAPASVRTALLATEGARD
jgi:hypothetical protein